MKLPQLLNICLALELAACDTNITNGMSDSVPEQTSAVSESETTPEDEAAVPETESEAITEEPTQPI